MPEACVWIKQLLLNCTNKTMLFGPFLWLSIKTGFHITSKEWHSLINCCSWHTAWFVSVHGTQLDLLYAHCRWLVWSIGRMQACHQRRNRLWLYIILLPGFLSSKCFQEKLDITSWDWNKKIRNCNDLLAKEMLYSIRIIVYTV